MNPETVLQIIKLSLEIALQIAKSIPEAQHKAFWERHEKRMQFWDDLFDRLQGKSEPKP